MNIEQIVQYFKQDHIIAYPTEAVFGLGCNPHSEQAVKNLLHLKQRPIEKGLILIAHQLDYLRPFIATEQLNPQHWQKLTTEYDRPITWVVPCKHHIPIWLTGQFNSIAIRLCRHPAVQQLCEQTHSALISTSANLSGLTPCKTADEVRLQFGKNFPVLDATIGNAQNPSQIRDIFSDQIFRNG